ncbi:MAG TPA: Gfo/Idh/MocA family oxidoreductase [Spirochaetia bacterium]|nr:Gfo/Idh/MocA family oxidoreductase [Spirochaetia bacterium]
MREIKIGVVGLLWGQRHVGTIQNIDGARVSAVAYDRTLPDGTTVEEFAKRFGATAFKDGIDMIEHAEIDAVDICTSPKWREPLIAAAAKRGLPVLIEKPMALNVAQAQKYAKIAEDAGIPLMVEYPFRFLPAVQRMKELLDGGPLGRPISVEGNLQTTWNPPKGHWTWDAGNKGGVVLESGCHLIDTLCFLCGEPQTVYSIGGSVQRHGDQEDTVAMIIEFKNRSHALVNIGGLGTNAYKNPMFVRVYAEHGEASVSGEDWRFSVVEWALADDTEPRREELEQPARFEVPRFNLMNFARVVRDGIAPPCSATDGIRVQRVIEAMARSIKSGQPAHVTP